MDDQTATQAEQEAPAEIHPKSYTGKSHIKVNKLGHMVYEVSDIERTVKFWTEVMGFEETDRNEHGMVFFRCGADHHAIGLKPGKKKRRPVGEWLKSGLLTMLNDWYLAIYKINQFVFNWLIINYLIHKFKSEFFIQKIDFL